MLALTHKTEYWTHTMSVYNTKVPNYTNVSPGFHVPQFVLTYIYGKRITSWPTETTPVAN